MDLLTKLKVRLDERLMYRTGAVDVTITMDDEAFTIPVYPLDWDQQVRVRQAEAMLEPEGMAHPEQAGVAIDTLINVTDEITPVSLDAGDLTGDQMDQLLDAAPKEGL